MTISLHEPPLVSHDLPGTGGAIGREVEDFCVEELPAYLPTGEGEHWYVELEKRGLSTPELVRIVAELAGVSERDIGYAGLKDKHAVTSQWLSLPGAALAPEKWTLPPALALKNVSRHGNKLRTGHLTGNRFSINLVGVEAEAYRRALAIAERLRGFGLLNYFGFQRFGRGGENLPRAHGWLADGARGRLSPFLLKLYPSVVQSELFNRYLTLRRDEGLERMLLGEVVRLEGSGACFAVEDVERESPRYEAREIHPTGPMLGPKMRPASGRPLELEREVAAALGIDERFERALGKFAPGARRDLRVFPRDLSVAQGGEDRLSLRFELPAGSYATVLIRELTRAPFADTSDRVRDA
jgi:tRNA pseudouridine13 synthase